RDADSVIAYLRRTPGVQLGSTRLLRSKLALMRVAESLANMHEPFDGPLQLLSGLEDVDRTEAIAVLDAYFASNGNVSEAARQIHVHPNTFRYRLAKISDIVNVDLENREDRLLVELDLLRVRFTS
ncbi:MAG: helix-turn-helix domain-containing protein, partial [Candidatus Nanopelagicales bacterium]